MSDPVESANDTSSDEDENCVLKGECVSKKAFFRCIKHEKQPKCPFLCIMRTKSEVSRRKECEGPVKSYRCEIRNPFHNHPPTFRKMVKHLLLRMHEEAYETKFDLHLKLRDIVSLPEKKYNILINSKAFHNKITYQAVQGTLAYTRVQR